MNQLELLAKLSPPPEVTSDELAQGMHLSYMNAVSLLADAKRLRRTSPGRAMALAILAMEEIAKIFLLYEFAISSAGRPVPGQDVARVVRTHSHKQLVFALYGTRIKPSSFGYEVEVPLGLVEVLDRFKQLNFYVDLTTTGFLSPTIFGAENADWADWAIGAVDERLKSLEPLHSTPEKSRAFLQFGLSTLKTVAQAWVESGGIDSPGAQAAVRDALREIMRNRPETLVREGSLAQRLRREVRLMGLRVWTVFRRASQSIRSRK